MQVGPSHNYGGQFMSHSGPRGPSMQGGMNSAGMGSVMSAAGMAQMGMNASRAPGMNPMYTGQRIPPNGYTGQLQGQPMPRQTVKRTYSSEVRPETELYAIVLTSERFIIKKPTSPVSLLSIDLLCCITMFDVIVFSLWW